MVCRSCGAQINSSYRFCGACRARYRKIGLLVIAAIVVLFIAYAALTPGSKTVQPNNNSQTPANSQSPAPVGDFYSISIPPDTITLTAEQLETAYKIKGVILTKKDRAAFAAADSLYRGKTLLVSGEANSSVYEDEDKNIHASFKSASDELAGVQVVFRFEEKSKLANLLEGDSVTALCRGDGVAGSVPQLADCLLKSRGPGESSILSDQIKATLASDGVKLDEYSYHQGTLDCSIDAGDWLTVDPSGLRNHLSRPLRSLYVLVNKFPQIQVIDVMLESPAAPKKDEHGHDLPAGIANTAHMRIDAGDFRKYAKDFDWNLYPVYVANRYMTWVNWSIQSVWKSELRDEIRLGGFREH